MKLISILKTIKNLIPNTFLKGIIGGIIKILSLSRYKSLNLKNRGKLLFDLRKNNKTQL